MNRLKIEIERFSEFAQVTFMATDGTKHTVFMDKFILASDPRIQKIKSQIFPVLHSQEEMT